MIRYRDLPRNARVCIPLEPLWSLFGPLMTFYMPLYQKELGLTEMQMGLVNSANIAAGLVFYMLAAPLSDKYGRRNTSTWFDFLAWSLSMVLWALSRSFAWFLAAAITNAVVRIVIVAWNLLISEDANDDQRAAIFTTMNAISALGGFSTLLGGYLISRNGVEPSMRFISWAGAVTMTIMFILRYLGTRETGPGLYLIEKTRGRSLASLVALQVPKARAALKDPFFVRMTGIYFIANAVLSIDFFRVLYLTKYKNLSPAVVSALPALGAIATVGVFFVILPRSKKRSHESHLKISFIACALFQFFFIFIPRGSWLLAFVVFPSLQASYVLIQSFRDTVFMNGTHPEKRSDRFSLIQVFMLLFSIPMGWLAGLLYEAGPFLPFGLAVILYGAGFLLARNLLIESSRQGT